MECSLRLPHLAAALVIVLTAGCGRPAPTRTQSDDAANRRPATQTSTSRSTGSGTWSEERRADLLNRIRSADPKQATIERALINERNELGLIMNRQTNLDDLPKLVRTMLAEMDKVFPGEDHTVVAYTPTNPPRVIGTGRLNARTRDMTYTPASP
jgi:hypothetical protein